MGTKNDFYGNLLKRLSISALVLKCVVNIYIAFVGKLGYFTRILPSATTSPPWPQIPVMPDIVTIVTPFVMSLPFVG